jgi:hypothetical protein
MSGTNKLGIQTDFPNWSQLLSIVMANSLHAFMVYTPKISLSFLRILISKQLKKTILKSIEKSKLTNSNNDYDNPINLDKAEIVYLSIERDLVIFNLPNFYNPYSLALLPIDPNWRIYSVASGTPELNYLSKDCKLGRKKLIGSYEGYPLDTKITLGESGSPVLIMGTNYVVGYITYYEKAGTDEKPFQNGMYDLVSLQFSNNKIK